MRRPTLETRAPPWCRHNLSLTCVCRVLSTTFQATLSQDNSQTIFALAPTNHSMFAGKRLRPGTLCSLTFDGDRILEFYRIVVRARTSSHPVSWVFIRIDCTACAPSAHQIHSGMVCCGFEHLLVLLIANGWLAPRGLVGVTSEPWADSLSDLVITTACRNC